MSPRPSTPGQSVPSAERQQAQAVFRLAHAGAAKAIHGHALGRAAEAAFHLGCGAAEAHADAATERDDGGAHADGEGVDADARPACRDEVTQLVHGDQQAEAQHDHEEVGAVAEDLHGRFRGEGRV